MRTVYFIRHGHPDFPEGRRFCLGRIDLPLSARGRMHAGWLADYFTRHPVTGVYCSYLKRSRETAEGLSRGRWPVETVDGFEELNYGVWEGHDFSEIRRLDPKTIAIQGTTPEIAFPEGGEPYQEGFERFMKALRGVLARTTGDLAVVGHSGLGRIVLGHLKFGSLHRMFELHQPYAGISKIIERDGLLIVESVGVMPMDAPDEAECLRLLAEYGADAASFALGAERAEKASELAARLTKAGVSLDRPVLLAAARLMDIAKGREHPEKTAAEWVLRQGYPKVAKILGDQHDLPEESLAGITESTALFLADRLTQGGGEEAPPAGLPGPLVRAQRLMESALKKA